MITYISLGVGTVFSTCFTTFFFELNEKELGMLPILAGLGGVISFIIAPLLGQTFDKKKQS